MGQSKDQCSSVIVQIVKFLLHVNNSDAVILSSNSIISYTSLSSTVYLYVANEPVIESSSNLKFAPFNATYPKLDEHVQAAGFDISTHNSSLTIYSCKQMGFDI